MLPEFDEFGRVWVEVSTDPAHGGAGWGFGTCLWSPVTNRAGARRYQVMEEPQKGEGVLHFRREPSEETQLLPDDFALVWPVRDALAEKEIVLVEVPDCRGEAALREHAERLGDVAPGEPLLLEPAELRRELERLPGAERRGR